MVQGAEVIVDAFMWFREADMAELRMRLLPDVDVFVVGEADMTFQGEPKRFEFPALLEGRLAPWADRVVHWPIRIPPGLIRWQVESFQREGLKTAVASVASEGDTVVVSDVDEVWGPEMLGPWQDDIHAARHDFRKMSVYWRWGGAYSWPGAIGGPWEKMRDHSWQALRDHRWQLESVPSGWHFSWMGEPEDMRVKARSFSHREYADLPFEDMAEQGLWVDGRLSETDDVPAEWLEWLPVSWLRRVP